MTLLQLVSECKRNYVTLIQLMSERKEENDSGTVSIRMELSETWEMSETKVTLIQLVLEKT